MQFNHQQPEQAKHMSEKRPEQVPAKLEPCTNCTAPSSAKPSSNGPGYLSEKSRKGYEWESYEFSHPCHKLRTKCRGIWPEDSNTNKSREYYAMS